jgi:hypothetical protein
MDSQRLPAIHLTASLPQTLEDLLNGPDSDLFQDYQHFLEQSFCCENLYFWLDVQEYNDLCGQVTHSNNDFQFMRDQLSTHLEPSQQVVFNVVQQKCHAMVDTYIRPNANQEINIPCELREELLHQVFACGNYHPSIFTKVTKSVVELMRVNAFIPWISSYSSSSGLTMRSPSLHPTPSTSTSPTALSFSFVVDRWYSFNKPKEALSRSGSMDSTASLDANDNDDDNHHGEEKHRAQLVISPPPSPTISSPPASTRYRSMLQRVRHSFLPPSSTATSLKPSMSLKKEHHHQ